MNVKKIWTQQTRHTIRLFYDENETLRISPFSLSLSLSFLFSAFSLAHSFVEEFIEKVHKTYSTVHASNEPHDTKQLFYSSSSSNLRVCVYEHKKATRMRNEAIRKKYIFFWYLIYIGESMAKCLQRGKFCCFFSLLLFSLFFSVSLLHTNTCAADSKHQQEEFPSLERVLEFFLCCYCCYFTITIFTLL